MANTPVSDPAKQGDAVAIIPTATTAKTATPAAKPAAKPRPKPAAKSAAKSTAKPAAKAKTKAAATPAAKPAAKVAAKPAAKPKKTAPAKNAKPKKAAAPKINKSVKPKKSKLVRDSFTMPESEYDLFAAVKKRCVAKGVAVKKSEVLRAAIISFAALSDVTVLGAVKALDVIKTGRKPKGQK